MAESNVIGLVIAVILFVMILLVGMGAIGKVQNGIGDMFGIGQQQRDQLVAGSAVAACEHWLSNPNKYQAKAIIETFDIPGKLRPFGGKTDCCWSDTNSLKRDSLTVLEACAEDPGKTSCNGGYVKMTEPYVEKCVNACSALVEISNLVDQRCTTLSDEKKQSVIESTVQISNLCSTSTTNIGTINCG